MKDSSVRRQACFGRLPSHTAFRKQHGVGERVKRRAPRSKAKSYTVRELGINTVGLDELNAPFHTTTSALNHVWGYGG